MPFSLKCFCLQKTGRIGKKPTKPNFFPWCWNFVHACPWDDTGSICTYSSAWTLYFVLFLAFRHKQCASNIEQHMNIKNLKAQVNISIKWKKPETFGLQFCVLFIAFHWSHYYVYWNVLPSLVFDLCERLLASGFSCSSLNACVRVILNVYWKSPGNEKPSLLSVTNFYSVFLLPLSYLDCFVVVWVSFWLWGWFF